MKDLKPTLWRTCRVLASVPRLELMRRLTTEETPRTVSDLAVHTNLPDSAASESLRALNARGLIQSKRQGRYVYYTAEANPNVTDAPAILSALKTAFNTGLCDEEIIHHCTAYTHERRIILINALRSHPGASAELSKRTGISPQAARRHLKKLERRGLVERRDELHLLVLPENAFARALFLVALNQQAKT